MTNRIATLEPEQRARGAITMSAGNAGQAFAWAATEAGVPMVTVMAETANPLKVQACRDYGAEVVLEGAHVGDAFRALERIRDERGLVFTHPFDDAMVIAGHGTVGTRDPRRPARRRRRRRRDRRRRPDLRRRGRGRRSSGRRSGSTASSRPAPTR